MMPLQIGPMSAQDVSAVAEIEARQHQTPWSATGFEDALRHGWHTRVLRDTDHLSSTVCGYFVAMTVGDDEELLTITVAPENEGRGYGQRLLQCLIQEATARNAQRLFLEVRQSNHRAIRLYEAAGFTMSGMRKNYYVTPADAPRGQAAGREDAVLMVRPLQEPAA